VLGELILKPEISRVITAGGTWLTFGHLVYLIVGVIGVAVSAAFYHYLEKDFGRKYNTKSKRIFAGGHLILMNLGAVAQLLC
jgi:heme/copper-type cytochrome/quinol oxidase subunit 1